MVWKLECSIWREGEAYVARCDSLEILSHGKTAEEALGNLEEALELYLQYAPGAEIPAGTLNDIVNRSGLGRKVFAK